MIQIFFFDNTSNHNFEASTGLKLNQYYEKESLWQLTQSIFDKGFNITMYHTNNDEKDIILFISQKMFQYK